MSMNSASVGTTAAPKNRAIDSSLEVSASFAWLFCAAVVGLILYYFIGIDQGATSVFGNDMHIHEWVHDSRHLLGFPCH